MTLIEALLAAAGLDRVHWTATPMGGEGLLNTHTRIDIAGGGRYVVREYGWPWGEEEPFDRMAKEAWLLPRLESAGVAAPRVIASRRQGAASALLLSLVDGQPLGTIDRRTEAMWRATGAALRAVHEADIGMAGRPAGLLVAGGVDAFTGGGAAWHGSNTRDHAERLAAARPDLGIDIERCVKAVERFTDHLDARPVRLIHADANPWNVLVDPATAAATWVDWEFAWLGDPIYDFLRMTLARKRDLGPLPGALFAGYRGDPTDDPAFAAYALGFHLWMGNEARKPLLPLQTTYENAERYLQRLPEHLDRLEGLMR